MNRVDHEFFMARALELARRGWGTTHPNPMVGAVVVHRGSIIGQGFHARAGLPHAEVEALRSLGRNCPPEAVLYVTLEPCSTYGRTPPCTEAILASGVRRLVVGAIDPSPCHSGQGIDLLRARGLEVLTGILEPECLDLNLIFHHRVRCQSPLVALKVACTLDGRIATATGDSKWITSEVARHENMRWRQYFPAIGVGVGTVLADDPSLTVRIPGGEESCPTRFVFDRHLLLAAQPDPPRLLRDRWRDQTIVVCEAASDPTAQARLRAKGVPLWALHGSDSRDRWGDFRRRCLQAGLHGVLVEGGRSLAASLLLSQSADYLFLYRAPLLLADPAAIPAFSGRSAPFLGDGVALRSPQRAVLGEDDLLRGFLQFPS